MKHMRRRFWAISGAVAVALTIGFVPRAAGAADPCAASEICPGTSVNGGNLERLKPLKFQGTALGDLIPERLQWQIREHGLAMRLVAPTPYPLDPDFVAASKANAAGVRLDPETGILVGWKAGAPFPNIDMADPQVGAKLIWNLVYGRQVANSINEPKFVYLLIDGVAGLERKQIWTFRQLLMKGRYGPNVPPVLGNGEIYNKMLLFAIDPQDIKGVGTFAIRYDTGKLDDSWAYLRDVRRVRRLSGGSWMTPIGSTDSLGDDFGVFGAYPAWYRGFKLVGKRKMLVVANAEGPSWVEGAASFADEFPHFDLANAPHWNPINNWEMREVYVVETTPPADHPLSKKTVYLDAQVWHPYFGEAFDRNDDFKKSYIFSYRAWPNNDGAGRVALGVDWGAVMDFQRKHATIFTSHRSWSYGGPMTEDDVSLAGLEAQGR